MTQRRINCTGTCTCITQNLHNGVATKAVNSIETTYISFNNWIRGGDKWQGIHTQLFSVVAHHKTPSKNLAYNRIDYFLFCVKDNSKIILCSVYLPYLKTIPPSPAVHNKTDDDMTRHAPAVCRWWALWRGWRRAGCHRCRCRCDCCRIAPLAALR